MDDKKKQLPPGYYYNVAGVLCCDELLEEDKMDECSDNESFPNSSKSKCKKNRWALVKQEKDEDAGTSGASTSGQGETFEASFSKTMGVTKRIKTERPTHFPSATVTELPQPRRDNFDHDRFMRHLFDNEGEAATALVRNEDFPPQLPAGGNDRLLQLLHRPMAHRYVHDAEGRRSPPHSPPRHGETIYHVPSVQIVIQPCCIAIYRPCPHREQEANYAPPPNIHNFIRHEQPADNYLFQQPQPTTIVIQQTIHIIPSNENVVIQQQPDNVGAQNPREGANDMGMEPPPQYDGGNGNVPTPPNGRATGPDHFM